MKTTAFEQQACRFCRSLHSGHCPAVRELEYHPDAAAGIKSPTKMRKMTRVLRREDIETAAAWKDGNDD